MTEAERLPVPEGYLKLELASRFPTDNGDIYWKEEADGVSFGTRILPRQCNHSGGCHGGWLATYLDVVLPITGRFTVAECEERFLKTVNLSIDYIGVAEAGDWLEGHATVLRATRRMLFIQGLLQVGDRLVARGSGIFRIGNVGPKLR